jgi:hypothetical protein
MPKRGGPSLHSTIMKEFRDTLRMKPRPFNSREFVYHPEGENADPSKPLAEEPAPVMRRVKAKRI